MREVAFIAVSAGGGEGGANRSDRKKHGFLVFSCFLKLYEYERWLMYVKS
jgi:hypothetical protein